MSDPVYVKLRYVKLRLWDLIPTAQEKIVAAYKDCGWDDPRDNDWWSYYIKVYENTETNT